jgi:hypothetical protein
VTEVSHPRNPLANRSGYTHLLLQELTDDEVIEYCEYWTAQRETYQVEDKGFAAWNASKRLGEGRREAARRGLRLERRDVRQAKVERVTT